MLYLSKLRRDSVGADFLTSEAQTYLSRLRRDSVGADFQSVRKLTNYVCAKPLEFSNIYCILSADARSHLTLVFPHTKLRFLGTFKYK